MKSFLCLLLLVLSSSLEAATVTGTLVDNSGTALTNGVVRFMPASNPGSASGSAVTGTQKTVNLSTNGTFSVSLLTGNYVVTAPGGWTWRISVPAGSASYEITTISSGLYTFPFSGIVRATDSDTNAASLDEKLVAGANITLTVVTNAGVVQLQITGEAGGSAGTNSVIYINGTEVDGANFTNSSTFVFGITGSTNVFGFATNIISNQISDGTVTADDLASNSVENSEAADNLNFATLTVNDDAYAAGWNGSTNVPTKNAVYDKIETLIIGGGSDSTAIHDDTGGEISAIADKATPVAADHLLIEDSAAADAKKDITIGSLETALEGVIDLQDLQGAVTSSQVGTGAISGGTGGQITDASITAADLGADSVAASELDAASVESELEAVIDLQDLQGAVTDAQVPNTITIDQATLALTGDSATAFFSSGTLEDARLPSSMADKIITGSFQLPNGAAPTTDATGEIALDTTITEHKSLLQYDGGADEMIVIALPRANLDTTDGDVVKYDAATDSFVMSPDLNSGSATPFNDLGDSTGAGSVTIAHTNIWIYSPDGGRALTIHMSDTDNTSDTTGLTITHNDSGDANSIFFEAIDDVDSAQTSIFKISATGITTTLPASFGVGSSAAGTITLNEGTAPSLTANAFSIYAGADVAAGGLAYVLPTAAATGIMKASNSSGVMTISHDGAFSDLAGAATDAQIPNTITIDLATLASTVTVVDGTDSTSFVAIFDSATGSLAVKTDGGLLYNASTGDLAPTSLSTATITLTGTGTLNGLDAIDSTGETTLESTLDIGGEVTSTGMSSTVIADSVTVATWTMTGAPGLTVNNGATAAGSIGFKEDSDNGANTATLIGPSSTADVTITLPAATGTVVLEDNTVTFTGKTYDAAGTGNVLKFIEYRDFVFPTAVDGAGTTMTTNNYTSFLSGKATSAGSGSTNANYALFDLGTVPRDIDTGTELVLKDLAIRVSGTDTDSATFTIGLWSPASSSAASPTDYTSLSTFISISSGTLTSPAAGDIFYINDTTLTGWAAAVTGGRPFIIGIARLDSSNDDSITIFGGSIQYTRTK